MTIKQLKRFFEAHDDEFLKFERIPKERRSTRRPDLHAFLMLDALVPGETDIVACAEHDEIYLDVSAEDLAKIATEDQLVDLIRCGVRHDPDNDSFCMFT